MQSEKMAVRYRSRTGAPLISVTQVLTLAGRIDTTWFTPEAAARGSLVHLLTEKFDRGEKLIIPEDVAGYMDAYASFIGTVRPVWSDIELEVQNPLAMPMVGGRLDRIAAKMFGEKAQVDIKTGPRAAWHGKQMAGYNILRGEYVPRFTLHLKSDGRWELVEHDDVEDYRRFQYDVALIEGTVTPDGDFWVKR